VTQARKQRKTEPFSIRLSPATDAIVTDEARRSGRSRGAIVEELALEAAKMRLFPGIGFRGRPRRAWVIGTGLDVWEVIDLLDSFESATVEILDSYPLLTERALRLAQVYAERFPEEITHFLEGNRRPLDELRSLYPFIRFGD
jgi:uncharacterized protein (DUF433 family)